MSPLFYCIKHKWLIFTFKDSHSLFPPCLSFLIQCWDTSAQGKLSSKNLYGFPLVAPNMGVLAIPPSHYPPSNSSLLWCLQRSGQKLRYWYVKTFTYQARKYRLPCLLLFYYLLNTYNAGYPCGKDCLFFYVCKNHHSEGYSPWQVLPGNMVIQISQHDSEIHEVTFLFLLIISWF